MNYFVIEIDEIDENGDPLRLFGPMNWVEATDKICELAQKDAGTVIISGGEDYCELENGNHLYVIQAEE